MFSDRRLNCPSVDSKRKEHQRVVPTNVKSYLKIRRVGVPYGVDGFRHFIVQQPQYKIQEMTSQIIEHDSFTTLICKKVKNISKLITGKINVVLLLVIFRNSFSFGLCQSVTYKYFVVWTFKLCFYWKTHPHIERNQIWTCENKLNLFISSLYSLSSFKLVLWWQSSTLWWKLD